MAMLEKRRRGRPRETAEDAPAIQSLDRAIALLGALAEADGMSLTEIAAAAGLPASSCYRLLTTLARRRMVEFEAGTQLWHIGVETFRIGAAFLRRRKLAELGRTAMQALVDRSGETANLAVAEADSVVFVSQVETHAAIRAFFRPGTRSRLHASGIGKAILSQLPPAQAATMLARTTLERFTPATITDPAALLRELAVARTRGFAVDDEERHLGMRCVAAAIFNEYGEPVAGLSVSGPSVRLPPETVARFGPEVAAAAAALTEALGGRAPAG
jgi:IclR family transcriptional regulator, acetate operon repressor